MKRSQESKHIKTLFEPLFVRNFLVKRPRAQKRRQVHQVQHFCRSRTAMATRAILGMRGGQDWLLCILGATHTVFLTETDSSLYSNMVL